MLDALKLALEVAVSQQIQVLGPNSHPLQKQYLLLASEASCQPFAPHLWRSLHLSESGHKLPITAELVIWSNASMKSK